MRKEADGRRDAVVADHEIFFSEVRHNDALCVTHSAIYIHQESGDFEHRDGILRSQ